MELPKLKPRTEAQIKRPKILLLSDDMMSTSGIGTMSRTFVVGTADKFNWVQLAAALNHPESGKVIDISEHINQEAGIDNASVKLYCNSGYGNPDILRRVLELEQPDLVLHFTDPRFWEWLYNMEYELHTQYKIPIAYYAIWDNLPYPYWNISAYQSCDLLMGISKQSHIIHQQVLNHNDVKTVDLDKDPLTDYKPGDVLVRYVPHGIDPKLFRPIEEGDKDLEDYNKFVEEFTTKNNSDFVVYWTNRNIRRKQPADLFLAFKIFCDSLTPEQAAKCVLFLHTSPVDEHGTDLFAVKRAICPNLKVIFSVNKIPPRDMNFFYNLADVTVNIGSNEGFGLSNAESLMAGTMAITNVTGGLQDQLRFTDDSGNVWEPSVDRPTNHNGRHKTCGLFAIPIFPSNRSLQGSPATPYIYDDRCDPEDVAEALGMVYKLTREQRKYHGKLGHEWMMSKESKMSAQAMSDGIADSLLKTIEVFKPKSKVELIPAGFPKAITKTGITLNNK